MVSKENISAPVKCDLTHPIRLDSITQTSNTITLDATVAECATLAARFNLSYVRNLSAEVSFRRMRSGQMVRVDGRITANYGQLCSMTLSPMPMVMEESFQSEYTLAPWETYSEFDLDQPEVLTDDFIDMGDVVAQYFGLSIDPYARRAGADRLPELAQYLSHAVQELLAAPVVEAIPALEALAELISSPPEPAELFEVIAPVYEVARFKMPKPEKGSQASIVEETPKGNSEDEAPNQSLFMKYLSRLRAA